MRPRYVGPLIVLSQNYGGAYILCELNGTVLHRPIGAFRVIPYFPRKSINLPDDFIDIDTARLRERQKIICNEFSSDKEKEGIFEDEIDDDDDKEDEKEFEDGLAPARLWPFNFKSRH